MKSKSGTKDKIYPFSAIRKCSYCGRFAKTPGGYKDRATSYNWGYLYINDTYEPYGICTDCVGYFDELFGNLDIYECYYCGDKFRVGDKTKRLEKSIKKWREQKQIFHFPIQFEIYFTCKKKECLSKLKSRRESGYLEKKLRAGKKMLNDELKLLRDAIKGE